mmetsp:Transcript_41375/g.86643  ORF Transcript_41375/g.86643 Transcript_41375/m.86643 type:complete len:606 (-) Transcript_41375:537-2354(-)
MTASVSASLVWLMLSLLLSSVFAAEDTCVTRMTLADHPDGICVQNFDVVEVEASLTERTCVQSVDMTIDGERPYFAAEAGSCWASSSASTPVLRGPYQDANCSVLWDGWTSANLLDATAGACAEWPVSPLPVYQNFLFPAAEHSHYVLSCSGLCTTEPRSPPSPPALPPVPPPPSRPPAPPRPPSYPPTCETSIIFHPSSACSVSARTRLSSYVSTVGDCIAHEDVQLNGAPLYFRAAEGSCFSPAPAIARLPKVLGPFSDPTCETLVNGYASDDLIDSIIACTPWPKSEAPLIVALNQPGDYYTLACDVLSYGRCDSPFPPSSSPPPPLALAPFTPGTFDVDVDDPCFDRESTFVCRVADRAVDLATAYAACFGAGGGAAAARVPMADLAAGDVVLDGVKSAARVVVNQHRHSETTSTILRITHAGGALSLTPDHLLFVNGVLSPASSVRIGDALGDTIVSDVSVGRGRVINAITESGVILAADAAGAAVLAATANAWLADVLFSPYAVNSVAFTVSRFFPEHAQVFYDAVLEPFFNAAVPILAELKRSSPSVLSWTGVVLADVLIGVGFATFCLAPLIVKALISASVVLLGLRAFRRPCAKVD